MPAEGLVHVTTLADDYYRFDRRSHTLTGNRSGNAFRLGDMVRVEVARVDIDRRELDFRIVQKKRTSTAAGQNQPRESQTLAGTEGRGKKTHSPR